MIKGFNSDIVVKGKNYHVQSEDWGRDKASLVSRVFQNGAVIKTIKISYSEALNSGPVNDTEALKQALRRKHTRVLDDLTAGRI